MNKLIPEQLFHALREDFMNVDYSKWERHHQKNGSKIVKAKPVLQGKAHSACEVFTSSYGATTERETTESANDIKESEKSGKSRRNATEYSSTVSSRLSRRIKANDGKQSLTCRKENTKTQKLLIKLQKRSIEDLEKHCEMLLKTNQQVARDIEDTDRHCFSSARKFLIHHEQLGSSIDALNRWSNWQIKQAEAELKYAVKEAEDHLFGLLIQLKAVKDDLVNARTEFHILKTYKDEEYPVKVLQIAEVKRDLEKLKEAQQIEHDDLKLLCQTEMSRLEKQLHQKQQEVLSAVAKKNKSHLPLVVKRMALHNSTMKEEIDLHKKEIMQLEEENRKLFKSIEELHLFRPNISREVFQDVFPKSDKCAPEMDVCLRIPREQWLPI